MSDRSALETEREFLLRSLDDLEAERDAGDIDDATYRSLHEDYTARAAAVIRSLRTDAAPMLPQAPPMSRRRKFMTGAGIAVFAAVAAVVLAQALGTRDPGQTITGNSDADESSLEVLEQAARTQPDDYDARIAYARALLGSDLAQALREFDAASQLEPTQPEPPTYIGWINALAARQLDPGPDRDAVIQRALSSLAQAITIDPDYEDAYVYRALTNMNVVGDAAAAVPDFQRFLALAPADHPQRELVLGALAEADAATSPTTVSTP
jgi:tetratricopeptide (TPR) repeat protein